MNASQARALKGIGIDLSKVSSVEISQTITACGINGLGHILAEIGAKKNKRLQKLACPDGAIEYQPETRAYAQEGYLGPRTLKKLRQANRGY